MLPYNTFSLHQTPHFLDSIMLTCQHFLTAMEFVFLGQYHAQAQSFDLVSHV